MIHVKNISHAYGTVQTLNNLSVNIPKEKITAIIGSNGAGKSTLLSIMGRLLTPDQGAVFLYNQNIRNLKQNDIAQKISVLRQTQNLNLKITIKELVAFGRYPHSFGRLKEKDEKIITEALRFLNLTDIENKYIDELSGGQRQRAYIAMTLAQDTDCLLLNEPLNNLDIKHSIETMNILKRLVSELHKTVVIVLHDINIAASFVDEIIALRKGELVVHGPVDEVVTQETLYKVFDFNFDVIDYNNKRICLYTQDACNHASNAQKSKGENI